ncbi:MAG: GNAT family N-acetyltransferase [bacterium]
MSSPDMRRIEVLRSHLEMPDPSHLRPRPQPAGDFALERTRLHAAEYRRIYAAVGERWIWRDRLRMAEGELEAYLASADVALWVLREHDQVAGYFELLRHPDARVEIMYFGLVPEFMGRGLGGWLLTRAVEEAFALGAHQVTLHTCSLDAPQALPNYLARGFVVVREERFFEESD